MSTPLHVVIAGGGTAGWMAANLFAALCPKERVRVTLVESPDIGIIGVGEGSTPTLKRFFEIIKVPEQVWMPTCNATYKVGIKFNDWSPKSGIHSYRHPFISQTDIFTQRAFEVNCHTRRLGLDTHTRPEDFLINGVLAKKNLGPLTPAHFPFTIQYGYHFDSALLGQFLSEHAQKQGVTHIKKGILAVKTHPDTSIASLLCDDDTEISGDFFIDCTGFRSLLLQQTLGVQFKSYKSNLFNDSAVVLPTSISNTIPSETEATALSAGWCWRIPLQNRFGNGYVYSAEYLSPDSAEEEFRRHLGILDSDDSCRHLSMKVGQVEQHWKKNCLALGLSQGFIEPLEATALHLVQICAEMFISKWQQGDYSSTHQQAFNAFAKERFDRVRDYIVAHYKLNTREDSEYWRDNRENDAISSSLANIINCWFQRKDLTQEIKRQDIGMHWDPISWHCLFSGYGAYPPLAPDQPGKGDHFAEKNIDTFVQGCALNFESHNANLASLLE
ncbi:tryptophan 7-halogenase [Alteromonas sediminis]|uniref:Tryptophan 7-halogenase n=1 Tax=Alteromonas sediminis TaxID=2259342 RepID=A0A3N5Y1N1_9ALTE|nr:tryptophan halogenase family protein [Alteromonas sediminis]RPJ67582.1 tryptophan 7-halogenase [Alteromonas sediminis]